MNGIINITDKNKILNGEAAIEGFLDEKNNFYNRYVAREIAMTNGQLSATTRQHKRDTGEKELFSEDLY